MKTQILFLAIIACIYTTQALAQKEKEKSLKGKPITLVRKDVTYKYKRGGGYAGESRHFYFIVEGEPVRKAGALGQKLRPFIQSSPRAISELNKYRNMKLSEYGCNVVYLGAGFGYILTAYLSDEFFSGGQIAMLGIAFAALAGKYVFYFSEPKHIRNAVKEYNNSIGVKSSNLFNKFKPNSMGLGLIKNDNSVNPALKLTWALSK